MIKITSTATAKLFIEGSSIELDSCEARTFSFDNLDGKTINAGFACFSPYIEGANQIALEGKDGNGDFIDFYGSLQPFSLALGTNPETYEENNRLVAHQKLKGYLDNLGFTTEIFL